MTTLESRSFIATDADIDGIVDGVLAAQESMDSGPRRYLRALTAVTIHELDAPQRVRAAKIEKTDEAEMARQLVAFDKVRDRFYARVVARASINLPVGKTRAKTLNERTNWARTIHSAIRRWIADRKDIRCVAAGKAIKSTFTVQIRTRPASPARMKARVEAASKATVAAVIELAGTDKPAAVAEIRLLMGQLAEQLRELGVHATKDAQKAIAEGLPLQVGKNIFMPSETQVMRMQERPS